MSTPRAKKAAPRASYVAAPAASTRGPRPGQEGGVRVENRKKRTDDLLRAACDLFLERGLEEVTIDDIVQAAGVAKGSFYRYFADKAAIVEALFDPVASRVREAFAHCNAALPHATTAEALTAAYMALAVELGATLLGDPKIARLYLQECRGPALGARKPVVAIADEIRRGAIVLTEAAQRYGLLRKMNPSVSALAVIGATERLMFAYLTGEFVGPPEAIPADLITLVLEGISVPAARRPARE